MSREEKAVLVALRRKDYLEEALELAEAAGYNVISEFLVRDFKGSKYGITTGKALELRELVRRLKPDTVIIDAPLKSSQNFNLTKLLETRIVDREKLILEIFAKRARTPEAKLQVKLAEITYLLPRIKELIRRVKLGEQPGLYGYGEYEVERYYDHIRRLQSRIKEELKRVQRHRRVQRDARRRWGLPLLSLAGYTGAGKTTLFNTLTKEQKPVSNSMFTTLTTTTRSIWLPGNSYALLTDTVGFISRLPHYMIEAFKSTLEELAYADLVLLVIDISEPIEVVARKIEDSVIILEDLGVDKERILYVFNKIDLVAANVDDKISNVKKLVPEIQHYAPVSALKRLRIDKLRETIEELLGVRRQREVTVTV